ncbi:MAG: bis-aminopropyl spermidine synthase family protein [Candidatus Hodarchaeota archaeon]
MTSFPPLDVLNVIAQTTKLKEGSEAVRLIMWLIYQHSKLSTKKLSRLTQIPLPVLSAVLNELKKEGLVERRRGTQLSASGLDFVENVFHFRKVPPVKCPQCASKTLIIPAELTNLLSVLRNYSSQAPSSKTTLDQARCTPETSLLRSLYLLDAGDLAGKRLLFLGDNDLTALACALVTSHFSLKSEFTVVDIDNDLLQFLANVSKKENFQIQLILHDLRKPLPQMLKEKFDVIITDPPYTSPGVLLFLSRGIECLVHPRGGKNLYLSFNARGDEEMHVLQHSFLEMNLFFKHILPAFNTYIGAEILGNVSQFIHLKSLKNAKPFYVGEFLEPIYTGELKITKRTYLCINCRLEIKVGKTEKFVTIEALKAHGCPKCQKLKFRLLKRNSQNLEGNQARG